MQGSRDMRNKWIGLILTIVLSVAGVVAVFLGFTENGGASDWYAAVVIGSVSLLGQIPYYIAFRMLGDKDNIVLRLLRGILILAGSAIIVISGALVSLAHVSEIDTVLKLSPWKAAFGGCWLLGGAISFHLFYSACDGDWEEGVFPFIGLISTAVAYAVCVALTFLGQKAGGFFAGWLVALLGVAGVVLAIVRLIREGSPFGTGRIWNGGTDNAGQKSSGTGSVGTATGDDDEVDNRAEGSDWKLKSAISGALPRGYQRDWQYGEIYVDSTSVEISSFSNTVIVNGRIRCTWQFDAEGIARNSLDIKDQVQKIADEYAEKFCRLAFEAFGEFREKYSGYDQEWAVKPGRVEAKFEPRG